MGGRFVWSSVSDLIGRKSTYLLFFLLGAILYALVPAVGAGNMALFVLFYVIILSMYGGGFATIPAYLADLFGTRHVGAIHGRLLTAWSVAGVLGPVIVNYMRDYQIKAGMATVTAAKGTPAFAAAETLIKSSAYGNTMYVMAGLLVLGLICNALVKHVDKRFITVEG
jgi:MFS family permease